MLLPLPSIFSYSDVLSIPSLYVLKISVRSAEVLARYSGWDTLNELIILLHRPLSSAIPMYSFNTFSLFYRNSCELRGAILITHKAI